MIAVECHCRRAPTEIGKLGTRSFLASNIIGAEAMGGTIQFLEDELRKLLRVMPRTSAVRENITHIQKMLKHMKRKPYDWEMAPTESTGSAESQ